MLSLLLVAAALLVADVKAGADVQVKLRDGVFKGETLEADGGRRVHSFRGIPFAKPPVGDLRFKDPEPMEAWQGTKDSFTPPPCPQIDMLAAMKGETGPDGGPDVIGEEDCLYLHVYTPKLCGTELLPVMVFIHGGGFIGGSADSFGGGPLPLLTRDVVLVSLQYRLGTLGFLSTEDSVLPGNMGLKDQTQAFRWVRDNIRSFGGDPDSVTIFGVSAGGASVHLQMFTPKAEGLFHRVIMESGSALCPWAVRDDHQRVAAGVARQVKCSGVQAADGSLDSPALLACLQTVPFKDLVLAATQGESWDMFPFYMAPRVDGDYLPAHPARLLREGRYHKVDLISGVCQHEGAMFIIRALGTPLGEELLGNFDAKAPISVGTEQEERPVHLARRIYYEYLGAGNITLSENNVDRFVQMFGDAIFAVPQDISSQFHARDASFGKSVYIYQLEHRGENVFKEMLNITMDIPWVMHGEETRYLFDVMEVKPMKRPDDVFLREIILDLWTTFAATGNPTPDLSLGFRWTPAEPSSLNYLSLKPAAAMQPDPRVEVRAFFTDLPTKLNKMLFPEKFPAEVAVHEKSSELGHCHA